MTRLDIKASCPCGRCWILPVAVPAPAEDVASALLRARCGVCGSHPRVYLARCRLPERMVA